MRQIIYRKIAFLIIFSVIIGIGSVSVAGSDRNITKFLQENNWTPEVLETIDPWLLVAHASTILRDKKIPSFEAISQELLRRAFNRDPSVSLYIGIFFDHVIDDFTKAVPWYERALSTKNKKAAHLFLGMQYFFGHKVTANYKLAKHHLLKSDDPYGAETLGRMYLEGLGAKSNKSEALKWFRLSISKGRIETMRLISRYYRDGNFGLDAHIEKAFAWLIAGAYFGDKWALKDIPFIYPCLAPETVQNAKQRAARFIAEFKPAIAAASKTKNKVQP